jgi:hypothetical protein
LVAIALCSATLKFKRFAGGAQVFVLLLSCSSAIICIVVGFVVFSTGVSALRWPTAGPTEAFSMTKEPVMLTEASSMRIASYLIHKGLLSLEQAQKIIKYQESDERSRERFGEIAVRLGYISEDALERAVQEKHAQSIN